MNVADKLRRARERAVTVEGHKFVFRRPTQLDIIEVQAKNGELNLRAALGFFVDWDLTELDLGIPGGTGDQVPFSQEALQEFVADHPKYWAPLMEAVTEAYLEYSKKLEEDAGNS